MAGALILRISYGYTAEPHKDDYLVDIAGDAVDKFTQSAVPGAYLVDMLPWLKHVPGFIPGTAFQQRARQWAHELEQVTEQPYAFVKHQMAQGVNEPSFLSKLIEAGDAPGDQAFSNKWAAQSLYSAGSDTSVAALECFFLAMMVFPEVQRRAQEEIDRVIGKDRLPMLADREKLPYIEGVMKETLRWNPVAPMCLPHTSIEDDVYNGYLIPKSSMLFPNIWHFTHDPESYPDPDEFKPQRYLGAAPAPDPAQYVFGFGRRVCPARLLAQNSVFLMVAQTLAAFDVAKPVEDGKVVEPSVEFLSGVVSHPAPFKASITPRSAHHGRLVESLERAYPWRQGDGHVLESIRTRA
jgi:cytochrome P450